METSNTTPNNENESSNENQTPSQDEQQPVPQNNIITPFENKKNYFDDVQEQIDELTNAQSELLGGATEMFSKLKGDLDSNPNDINASDARMKMMFSMTGNLLKNIPEKTKQKGILYITALVYFIVLGIISCIQMAINFPKPTSYLSVAVLAFILYQITETMFYKISVKIRSRKNK